MLGNISGKAVEASNEAIKGVKSIYDKAISRSNTNSAISQGNVFEDIEVAKFNENAIRKGSTSRAVTTESLGRTSDPVDVLIIENGEAIVEAQLKSGSNPTNLTNYLKDDKYSGMQKVTNSEHVDKVRELSSKRAEFDGVYKSGHEDTSNSVTGELHYEDVSSGGTSYDEALRATEQPEVYAAEKLVENAGREYFEFLKVGVPVSAGLSIITGLVKYYPHSRVKKLMSLSLLVQLQKSRVKLLVMWRYLVLFPHLFEILLK